jgi:hypothetical protein
MKKKYLKPNVLTVRIDNNLMIGTSDTAATSKEVLSRQGRFSDFDEEEE